MTTVSIEHNLRLLQHRLRETEKRFNRLPGSVSLLAVSKGHPPELIERLVDAGQHAIGENYVQDAIAKLSALKHKAIEWHYIGALQSNKNKQIAQHFDWVQTVSKPQDALRLARARGNLPPLNVCIQVKLENNPNRAGALPNDVLALADAILSLDTLCLRGLMTLPPESNNVETQRHYFRIVKSLFTQLQEKGIPVDTLSMGMSHDFEAAIAEGATLVRIGTALFGPRGTPT